MRFAEVFLRLGSSLVAWMMVFTYLVWMAALHAMGCGPDGDEMHRVLLGIGPLALAMALALRSTRPFPDIHRMLCRLAWPAALLGRNEGPARRELASSADGRAGRTDRPNEGPRTRKASRDGPRGKDTRGR